MKKLTISFIISLFIASNTFAAPLMPNIADYRAPIDMENSSSKAWAGYGANVVHDQAPDYSTENYYEIKFDNGKPVDRLVYYGMDGKVKWEKNT